MIHNNNDETIMIRNRITIMTHNRIIIYTHNHHLSFLVLLSIKLIVSPAFRYANSSILDANLSNSKSTVVLNMPIIII